MFTEAIRENPMGETLSYWSLTTLLEKLIKIGAKVVKHARYVTFQMAEVAVPGPPPADTTRSFGGYAG